MDYIVHGVAKSQTRLRDFHFTSLRELLKVQLEKQSMMTKSIVFLLFLLQVLSIYETRVLYFCLSICNTKCRFGEY